MEEAPKETPRKEEGEHQWNGKGGLLGIVRKDPFTMGRDIERRGG